MIVVDASVLTDFLLGRRESVDAVEALLHGRENEPLHAPELIEPETLNALRRLALGGHVSEQRAAEAVADLADVWVIRHPHAPLRGRVWERRHELTAYDATYLALAEALPDAVLVTGDGGLAARAEAILGPEHVCHIR